MDAKELRIGNLVQDYKGSSFEIIGNDIRDIETFASNQERVFGIPLSPEWFERFGFRHERIFEAVWCWRTDHFGIAYHTDDGEFFLYSYQFETQKFKYVHQLQNLYFALTGKELQISEP